MRKFLPLLFFILFYSCTAKLVKNNNEYNDLKSIVIKEPIYVEAKNNEIVSYDDETLFKKAEEALDNDDIQKGLFYYYLLLEKFPESKFIPPTLYNIGAIFEEEKKYPEAEKFYRYLIKKYPLHYLTPRAIFRLVLVLEAEEKFSEALKYLEKLNRFSLSREDRLKVIALKGILLSEMGRKREGEKYLMIADREYGKLALQKKKFDRYFWGWVRFQIAENVFTRYRDFHITGNSRDEMKKQLERKASLLLKALRLYFLTLKTRSMHWATAAVYRMGLLYELFYMELVQVKPPDTLTKEEKEVYYEELEKVLKPVKEKAIETYEKIIRYATAWGVKSEWLKKAKEHLEILKNFKIYQPEG